LAGGTCKHPHIVIAIAVPATGFSAGTGKLAEKRGYGWKTAINGHLI
jgi:hypothetical protein